MKNIFKQRKGITLIALVITIIVLLILAGISISMLSGDNSILQKATDAKINTDNANEKEQIQIVVLGSYNDNAKLEVATVNSNIKNRINGVTTDDATEFPLKVTYTATGNSYTVEYNGNVEKETPKVYSNEVKVAITEGKYVTYNNEKYIVLYDVNSGYNWIEIVSKNPLEKVTLGYNGIGLPTEDELLEQEYGTTNLEKSRWVYNNAIKILNDNAQKYLNTQFADRARCVGSDPINPLSESGFYDFPNIRVRNEDTNYTIGINTDFPNKDMDQLNLLDIAKFSDTTYGSYCWLASRYIDDQSNPSQIYFGLSCIYSRGSIKQGSAIYLTGGSTSNINRSFRPVVRLKYNINITGGNGTDSDPYTLGI